MEEPTTHGHSIPLAETVKELATYELPGDYVVIPLPVRDRIVAQLNKAEADLIEAHNRIDEAGPVLEAAREQARLSAELNKAVNDSSCTEDHYEALRLQFVNVSRATEQCIRAFDAARAAAGEEKR